MTQEFECNATASMLGSGRTVAAAAHAGAILAGIGLVYGQAAVARVFFLSAIFFWLAQCWLAVRVAIDAKLFRDMATEHDGGTHLDELLTRWKLRKQTVERSIEERSRAAIGLWRRQLAAAAIEMAMVAVGVTVQAFYF